jgi:hypothetical protein
MKVTIGDLIYFLAGCLPVFRNMIWLSLDAPQKFLKVHLTVDRGTFGDRFVGHSGSRHVGACKGQNQPI